MPTSGLTLISGAISAPTAPSTYPGVLTATSLSTSPYTGNAAIGTGYRIQVNTTTPGPYGGRVNLPSAVNFSGRYLTFRAALPSRVSDVTNQATAAGILLVAISSGGYRVWNLGGTNAPKMVDAQFLIDLNITNWQQSQGGTFDPSAVTAFELIHNRLAISGQSNLDFSSFYSTEKIIVTGGAVGSPVNLIDDLLLLNDQTSRPDLLAYRELADGICELFLPTSVETNHLLIDDAATFVLPPKAYYDGANSDLRVQVSNDLRFDFLTPANGTFTARRLQIKSSNAFAVNESKGASAATLFSSTIFENTSSLTAVHARTGGSIRGGAVTIAGASLDGTRLINNSSIALNSVSYPFSCTVEGSPPLTVNLPPGNYANLKLDLPSGQVIRLNGGGGTYEFQGLTSSGSVIFDPIDGQAYTINLPATGISASVASPPTSGSVVLVFPQVALTAPNLPDGAHYLIKYADGAFEELEIGTISGGSGLSFPLPTANNRLIRLLSIQVTSSPIYASHLLDFVFRNAGVSVSTEAELEEFTLYSEFGIDGLSPAITSKFTLDNPNLQIDASEVDGILSAREAHAFAWGQMQINPAALRLGYVPIEAFTRVGYIVRSSWKVENQSTTNPLLITDGYYVDESGNPYNPCAPAVGGKQSTSIQFEPTHTVEVTVTGNGLTPEQSTQLATVATNTQNLSTLIEDGTGAYKRFRATALEQAPTGGGGGLGPEDIERLERIENQLIADYWKGENRFQRYLPGTETVILDKDVVLESDGFHVTEHQEP